MDNLKWYTDLRINFYSGEILVSYIEGFKIHIYANRLVYKDVFMEITLDRNFRYIDIDIDENQPLKFLASILRHRFQVNFVNCKCLTPIETSHLRDAVFAKLHRTSSLNGFEYNDMREYIRHYSNQSHDLAGIQSIDMCTFISIHYYKLCFLE